MQGEVGLKSATDGEMRRQSWHMDFIYQLGGITKVQDETIKVAFHNKDKNFEWAPPSAHVTAPVSLPRDDLRRRVHLRPRQRVGGPDAEAHHPVAVHGALPRRPRRDLDATVYPDLAQFWDDLAAAYAKEIRQLHDLGCRYLQLDDTSLAYVNDPVQREHVKDIGGDPLHQHETYIATINKALAGRPADLTVTTHMCRGNNQSHVGRRGRLRLRGRHPVQQARRGRLLLRVGRRALRRLRAAPLPAQGQARRARRRHQQATASLSPRTSSSGRIEEAAKYADIDQLCLSAQCGFSSTSEGNDLTEQQQWDKLRLIVEVAEEIWGE